MEKELLTHISNQFCLNCCGEEKKQECDNRCTTCDKLASFLIGCNKYGEKKQETNKFRLPTKKEFENLAKLKYKFVDGTMHFYEDGRELILPAAGDRNGTAVYGVGTYGNYWSSTYSNSYYAYSFYFNSSYVNTSYDYYVRCNGHSVRLVSDTHFEGCIEIIGLYWKPENEPGLYTWEDAMKFEHPKEDDSAHQAKVQEYIDKYLEKQKDDSWKEYQEVYHEWLKIKDKYSFSDSDVAWKEAVKNYKNKK